MSNILKRTFTTKKSVEEKVEAPPVEEKKEPPKFDHEGLESL